MGLTDGDRDTAALLLAAIRRDDEGVQAVAGNLADPAGTSALLARLIAEHIDYNPESADELAGFLQRRAGGLPPGMTAPPGGGGRPGGAGLSG